MTNVSKNVLIGTVLFPDSMEIYRDIDYHLPYNAGEQRKVVVFPPNSADLLFGDTVNKYTRNLLICFLNKEGT